MSLQRYCQKSVVKMAPSDTISEACAMMATKNVGCLIVESEGKLCGILTDRDIALKVTGMEKNPKATKIGDIMTCDPIRVSVDKELNHVTSLMHAYHVRRVPIVNGFGTTLGIVTLDDLIALLGHEMSEIGKTIEEGFPETNN